MEDERELASPLLPTVKRKSAACTLSSQGAIVLLCTINLLNYVDRGIIPGAPQQFQSFISSTLHVPPTEQSFYLGLLASAFIASYCVCSLLFGFLALSVRPFRLIAGGMSIWMLAVIICGIARQADSYWVLLFGRILSGVGEASFQCVATPFIDLHAPKGRRAMYLGVFLASITVGTATGYIYGALFASSTLGWQFAFYLEAILMLCLVSLCIATIPMSIDKVDGSDIEFKASVDEAETENPWLSIFGNFHFVLIVAGYAAYTFSLASLSTFSPVIFIGLGFFDSETQVATVFGLLIVITGTIGTPIGGIVVDKMVQREGTTDTTSPLFSRRRCYLAVTTLITLITAAEILGLFMVTLSYHRTAFMTVLAGCFFCLCATAPAESIAVMELFPPRLRPMAIAANTLLIHVFGDVPSPLVLGWLKDHWAPHCGTIIIHGQPVLDPSCSKDHDGLRDLLLFAVVWLLWAVATWGLSYSFQRRNRSNTFV